MTLLTIPIAMALEINEVTLDHGMIVVKEEHKVAYEGSNPVHIAIDIPFMDPHATIDRLDNKHNCHKNTGITVCKYLDLLRPMYNHAFEIIQDNLRSLFASSQPLSFAPKEPKEPQIRVKRNIFGTFFNWCCSIVTEDEYLDVKAEEAVLEKCFKSRGRHPREAPGAAYRPG